MRVRKESKIISQSKMYVGFILKTKKSGDPKSVKASALFLRALAVCVFAPDIPQGSHPCVALSAYRSKLLYMSFSDFECKSTTII